ncbi:MAG: hypothetical protein NVS3B16_21940 [Vulcanimicrobiaceae bacterium]
MTLTSFLGRERESAMLLTRLVEQRLVTLTGVGGVGKTRLALEIAHGLIGRFPDGVWMVEFAPLADPALVRARVAAALGAGQGFESATASDDAWIGEFADKNFMVVLDNCEHVLAAAAELAQRFLERCPGVHVLVTSREPLRVQGEFVHRLDSLELPLSRDGQLPNLDDLRGSPAIRMFFDRARYAAPDFQITETDHASWHAMHTLCTRLDGMPLAIELAAARMNAMNLDTLTRALDRRFDLLTAGARTALPRHQTLRALVDWSYDLLTEDERRVLRRLAVFVGGWTLRAAEVVCICDDVSANEILAILASLVDKSLIFVSTAPDMTRYGMLETMRAYALERLIAEGEYDGVSRAHARYCLEFVRDANGRWGKPSVAAWLAPLEPELDNFRAAMHFALADPSDAALAANIAKAQHSVLEQLSLFGEGVEWCERALVALGADAAPDLEAPLHLVLAKFYGRAGFAKRGIANATRAVDLYRIVAEQTGRPKDRAALAVALSLAGRHLAFLGRNAEADRAASEGLAIARHVPDPGTMAWTLYVKSLTVDAADSRTRRALLDEALSYCRSLPESFVPGVVLLGLAHAEFDAGNFASAQKYARQAMDVYRVNCLNEDLAIYALSLSAIAALATGDDEVAHSDAREALSHARRWLDVSCAVQVVANVSARREGAKLAAHIIGASDVLFSETPMANIPIVQILHDRTLAQLREHVDEADLARWIATGRTWTYEELVAAARSL